MSDREEFEKACPVPKGVYWDSWSDDDGQYEAVSSEHEELADIQQARLQGWIAARAQQSGEGREPVATVGSDSSLAIVDMRFDLDPGTKLYTHPPKAQGVPEGWKLNHGHGVWEVIQPNGRPVAVPAELSEFFEAVFGDRS